MGFWMALSIVCCITFCGLLILSALVTVRPTQRGLIERFGKYNRYAQPGLNIVIPLVEAIQIVEITEQMVDANRQEIITDDNLNATVDAQVYFRVKPEVEDVKKSVYAVSDCQLQIVNLARTTLRNIIGTLSLKEANSERNRINKDLLNILSTETKGWGIDVVRTELKEIQPPQDVQNAMNEVVKAENEKLAAKDFATAEETKADGVKRAAIKAAEGEKRSRVLKAEGEKEGLVLEAEGNRQSRVLKAEGKAEAIKLEFTAANEHFKDGAQVLKKLETVEQSMSGNTKIVLPVEKGLVNVISDMAGITPLPLSKEFEVD